jgi:hypothetical protein
MNIHIGEHELQIKCMTVQIGDVSDEDVSDSGEYDHLLATPR